MKLLQRDRKRLESIAMNLSRGLAFVMDDRTALMRSTGMQSRDIFTAPYYPAERYHKCTKEIGSEFVLALTALRELQQALSGEKVVVEE